MIWGANEEMRKWLLVLWRVCKRIILNRGIIGKRRFLLLTTACHTVVQESEATLVLPLVETWIGLSPVSSHTLTLAVRHRVTVESFRAFAPEASHVISAQCVPSARRAGTFVKVGASLGRACVTIESGRAVAAITALHIRTYGTWSANSRLGALVHVGAPVVRIADEAVPAQTRVVAGHVDALSVHAARLRIQTLVDVYAKRKGEKRS